jgi:2'-5' RNA ligase
MRQIARKPFNPAQPGFEDIPAEHSNDRLFFAVYPTPHTAAGRIAPLAQRLRTELSLRGKPIATERFHSTVHFLGDYAGLSPDLLATARAAGAAVKMKPFHVSFDRAASFDSKPSNRPLVLRGSAGSRGLAGLHNFHDALGNALQRVGLGRWALPQFTPHITLLYDDRAVEEVATEEVSWPVTEFVLVHSLLGGSTHVPLGRWAFN